MRLESREELIQRIKEAAKYVPLERLALSPHGGSASTWEGNRITPKVQRQKLELVARTARLVWG
jgi:5-methyltetrahydropteroyltriglutamate--homocysteine methyltransferase